MSSESCSTRRTRTPWPKPATMPLPGRWLTQPWEGASEPQCQVVLERTELRKANRSMTPGFRRWYPPSELEQAGIAYQKLAVAFLEWACRGSSGVTEEDERFLVVAEGRRFVPPSSSCAELAHSMFFFLGVRLDWVNRTANGGWRVGQGVSLLCWPIGNLKRQSNSADRFEPGDVIVVWNRASGNGVRGNEHVACAIDHLDDDTLLTAEYGQPGGKLKRTKLEARDGYWYLGSRRVQRRLRLRDVLGAAAAQGKLVEAEEPIPEETELSE